jgi:hypothetical protein
MFKENSHTQFEEVNARSVKICVTEVGFWGWELDGTGSGLYPVVDCVCVGGSVTREIPGQPFRGPAYQTCHIAWGALIWFSVFLCLGSDLTGHQVRRKEVNCKERWDTQQRAFSIVIGHWQAPLPW